MTRHKKKHMEEAGRFSNVLDCRSAPKGNWAKEHFSNKCPLVLELGCGRGDYTLELARRFPEKNFIGVDIKGCRIWKGASSALDENLKNAAFLRIRIEYIAEFFSHNEVDEIWITFPDPFVKRGSSNRRLTSPFFLEQYRKFLKPEGKINLKTDDITLYSYTLETLINEKCILHEKSENIYSPPSNNEFLNILTTYERRHLEAGKTIKYTCFSFV